jgi:hypothetical protein
LYEELQVLGLRTYVESKLHSIPASGITACNKEIAHATTDMDNIAAASVTAYNKETEKCR